MSLISSTDITEIDLAYSEIKSLFLTDQCNLDIIKQANRRNYTWRNEIVNYPESCAMGLSLEIESINDPLLFGIDCCVMIFVQNIIPRD